MLATYNADVKGLNERISEVMKTNTNKIEERIRQKKNRSRSAASRSEKSIV